MLKARPLPLVPRAAFSLVELSIVLVILGLLTGGILTGQNLIRAAELRSVITEHSKYLTATMTFRDKYFALPGDMRNATDFWGASVVTNGNGDGAMNYAASAGTAGELYGYWQQLALAGLIEGEYSGLAGAGGVADSVNGVNVPVSKVGNAGWSIIYLGTVAASSTTYYEGPAGNIYAFGTTSTGTANMLAAVTPEEAWNIDTKLDDGKAGIGTVIMREALGSGAGTGCTDTAPGSTAASLVNYELSNTSIACSIIFRIK